MTRLPLLRLSLFASLCGAGPLSAAPPPTTFSGVYAGTLTAHYQGEETTCDVEVATAKSGDRFYFKERSLSCGGMLANVPQTNIDLDVGNSDYYLTDYFNYVGHCSQGYIRVRQGRSALIVNNEPEGLYVSLVKDVRIWMEGHLTRIGRAEIPARRKP